MNRLHLLAITALFGACGSAPLDDVELSSDLSSNGGINVARATKGATLIASSQAPGAPASSLINGDRRGVNWGNGGGWSDYTFQSHPDTVEITFSSPKLIDEIDVFSLQDNYASPIEPTESMTFSLYGARDFTVSVWDGSTWMRVGSATNNNLVWKKLVFAPVVTTKIRVRVTRGGTNGWTQLTEIEAWTTAPGSCASYCGGLAFRGCEDSCTAANNMATTCGQLGYTCIGGVAMPACSEVCNQWSSCFDRCTSNGVASSCETFACDRPKLRGEVALSYGSDVNRCVNNVVSQVQNLPQQGVLESFSYPSNFPETDRFNGDHWQGIVRLPSDPRRFLVTLNQEDHSEYSGYIGLISRETGGAQMMQRIDGSLDSEHPEGHVPHRYNHPGGGQALGTDYVFVGEEQQQASLDARVRIYAQQELLALNGINSGDHAPIVISEFPLPEDIDDRKGAAAVAAVKLRPLPGENGARYLMLVASQNFSYRLYYWVSQPGRSLDNPGWEKGGYLQLKEGDSYINGWGKQQNMNLLTNCTNTDLYLISWGMGETLVRLHKVDFHLDVNAGSILVGSIGNGTVATREVACGSVILGASCDFGAGAGAYVTRNGNLQVYVTSKYSSIYTTGFCNGGSCTTE